MASQFSVNPAALSARAICARPRPSCGSSSCRKSRVTTIFWNGTPNERRRDENNMQIICRASLAVIAARRTKCGGLADDEHRNRIWRPQPPRGANRLEAGRQTEICQPMFRFGPTLRLPGSSTVAWKPRNMVDSSARLYYKVVGIH